MKFIKAVKLGREGPSSIHAYFGIYDVLEVESIKRGA